MLKEIFAPHGKQLNPYSPANFPKSFDGGEGIDKEYSQPYYHWKDDKVKVPHRARRQ